MQTSGPCDNCDYNLAAGDSICTAGSGSCFDASLLSPLDAYPKAFHPNDLKIATMQINNILDNLRRHAPSGRELNLMRIPGGVMLAWVDHTQPPPPGAVTHNNTPDEIRPAVGLTE